MEVILKQDVRNLGYANDIVKVRPGYGRNFLIPRGIATLADEQSKKIHAENVKQRAHKEAKVKAEAEKSAGKLKDLVVKVSTRVGDNGKIFGSITSVQLADSLRKLGFDVDRRNITVDAADTVKTLGSYTGKVRLHKEVLAPFQFEIVAE